MAKSFAESVQANCKRVLEEVDRKCYSITWQLFTTIVHKTPVLTGALTNNWFPAVGANNYSAETTTTLSKSGSGSLSRINSLSGKKLFYGRDNVVTLTNNLSYAFRAEYEGWPAPQWSGKVGPYAMVRTSLLKVASENK